MLPDSAPPGTDGAGGDVDAGYPGPGGMGQDEEGDSLLGGNAAVGEGAAAAGGGGGGPLMDEIYEAPLPRSGSGGGAAPVGGGGGAAGSFTRGSTASGAGGAERSPRFTGVPAAVPRSTPVANSASARPSGF